MEISFELNREEDREYAIMLVASVGCPIKGIDDPTIYDHAMVDLRASERAAMMSRLIRSSYTSAINDGHRFDDDEIAAYDFLLDLYERKFFEAQKIEDQKWQAANKKIADTIAALWDRTNATIH